MIATPPVLPLSLVELAGIDGLELRSSVLADGFLAGLHRSEKPGSSPDFREFRPFTAGDATRGIDWRASARCDRLLVRLRENETNLKARIFLDSSRSMAFKSDSALFSKWDYARLLTAAIGTVLQKQQDSPGLDIVGARLDAQFPSSSRRTALNRMIAGLERAAIGDVSALPRYLTEFAMRGELRHGIAVVISDFYASPEKLGEAAALLAAADNDVIFLQVLDRAETEIEYTRQTLLSELEGNKRLNVNPDLDRAGFQRIVGDHLHALDNQLTRCGGQWALCRTDEPPMRSLELVFSVRQARLSGHGGRR